MHPFRILVALAFWSALAVPAADATKPAPKPLKPLQVKSLGQLARYLRLHNPQNFSAATAGGGQPPSLTGTTVSAPAGGAAGASGGAGSGAQFSSTNVQVAGVDEADFVKTDGTFIYQVHNSQVLVIQATPANQLAVLATIDLGSSFYPTDLYVLGNRLVVNGTYYDVLAGLTSVVTDPPANSASPGIAAVPAYAGPETQVLIYDITDKSNISQIRKIGFAGDLIASRRIGNIVYLVTRQYPVLIYADMGVSAAGAATGISGVSGLAGPGAKKSLKAVRQRKARPTHGNTVPLVRDSAKGPALFPLPLNCIFIFPNFSEPDFITVAGFDIQDPASPVDMKAYLGAGDNIYASPASLYIEASVFHNSIKLPPGMGNTTGGQTGSAVPAGGAGPAIRPIQFSFDETSSIYKFTLNKGTAVFQAQASVPGTVLNQFSMDETNGFFRVATSHSQFDSSAGESVSSGVYVFDSAMNAVGKLENIAPGERIFSARFIGDRAYLVTFKRIDPLFIIGLSQPAAPVVLGQITIPGVSDYLQPYDDTHLMGFGSDGDAAGHLSGFKMALFDVTDAANPILVSSVVIPHASSELQYDHRALLFDQSSGLLAFSITSNGNPGVLPLSPLGALTTIGSDVTTILSFIPLFSSSTEVYNVSPTGFVLQKEVPAEPGDFVNRVLRIGSTLYTISDGHIQALDQATLTKQNTLALPEPAQPIFAFGFGFGLVLGKAGALAP